LFPDLLELVRFDGQQGDVFVLHRNVGPSMTEFTVEAGHLRHPEPQFLLELSHPSL
jgi:hypothetical protein